MVSAGLPFSTASFEVNSEPHTGALPSARLCVGLKIGSCELPVNKGDVLKHMNTFDEYLSVAVTMRRVKT